MANLSSLAPLTNAIGALSGLILASPQTTKGYQPQNPPGPNGLLSLLSTPPALLFHYEGEQTAKLSSDITDHYIEDNTAVQNQIALKPVIITTQGFIGELNNVPPKILAPLQFYADKLTSVSSYVPSLSTTALIAYNEAFFLYQVGANALNAAVAAVGSLTGSNGGESVISGQGNNGGLSLQNNQNKQQTYFQLFYGYWSNRTLFTIQTPWAVFQNMAILDLRAIQDADTRMITGFEVSFKLIRTAQTGFLTEVQGRLGAAAVIGVDFGTSTPSSSISVAQGISNQRAVA